MTPSQFQSKIRQIQQKRKQAIDKYNREVRQRNQKVRMAVNKYNQEVRRYNENVRRNLEIIRQNVSKLNQRPTAIGYNVLQKTTYSLNTSHIRLINNESSMQNNRHSELMVDFPTQENANSLEVINSLMGEDVDSQDQEDTLGVTKIKDELSSISPDFNDRWHGAVYALHPNNPDAARHFCTSAREIFTGIFEIKAPDDDIFAVKPDCITTDQGKPTRRTKIQYLLNLKEIRSDEFEVFVDDDVKNILELFRIFNEATHGHAGKFNLNQLLKIKKRVEDGIIFLSHIAR